MGRQCNPSPGGRGALGRRAYSFNVPPSITGFPSSVTVAPISDTVCPYGTLLLPPAQVLPPVPTVTVPAGTQLPTLALAGSFTLGLMPKSMYANSSLRGSLTASYSAFRSAKPGPLPDIDTILPSLNSIVRLSTP